MATMTPQEIQYYKSHAGDSLQPNLIASNATGLVLAYIAVALRLWARRAAATRLGQDDLLILAAILPLTAYAIAGFLVVSFGEGKHIIFVTNVPGFIQGYIVAITAYALTVILTKLSILAFYCRIFPSKNLVRVSWVFVAIIVAYDVALVVVAALECIPLSSLWDMTPARCINTKPPFTALGIVNVLSDFAILALPIRFVAQLHMPRTRRVQVCAIFLLGSLVCIFGIVRVVALANAGSTDPSYNQVWSGIWSFCEIAIGIVAACLPTLGILFTKSHILSLTQSARNLLSTPFSRRSRTSPVTSAHCSTTRAGRDINMPDWPASKASSSIAAQNTEADSTPFAQGNGTERGRIEHRIEVTQTSKVTHART